MEPPRPDIVFISLENWDSIWRRNQFVCDELARRDAARRILFVGLPRDMTNDLRHLRLRSMWRASGHRRASQANIILANPTKWFPNTLAAGRLLNEWVMRRAIHGAMARHGIHRPLLWVNDHAAVHLVGKLRERAVIYDITDDWTTLTQSPAITERIRRQDEALCRVADAVIVCSERLRDMKSGMNANLHLVPNGVNARQYRDETDGGIPPGNWGRPVIGYVGTIHPDRIDVTLVDELAGEMPDASIVLVGPIFLAAEDMRRLSKRSNLRFTGPIDHADVPATLRGFDVCMTPHRVTPFTESLNPIKLWEYLAVGKPIVSTDVAGFRDYPRWVSITRTAREFAQACRRGLGEPSSIADGRRAEADRHSWGARVDEIERILAECVRRRGEA